MRPLLFLPGAKTRALFPNEFLSNPVRRKGIGSPPITLGEESESGKRTRIVLQGSHSQVHDVDIALSPAL
jgi:hypothetical protein